jgi:hypothetical protein
MQGPQPRQPTTTYSVVLRHADGTTSRMALSQAPGRLYDVGDAIELRDSEWKVAEIAMDEDGRTVLTCDSVERQDGR